MSRAKRPPVRLFVVTGCHRCPNCEHSRTPGAGYASDYHCTAVTPKRLVDGYVEWPSEMREDGDFPSFCPLKEPPKGWRRPKTKEEGDGSR